MGSSPVPEPPREGTHPSPLPSIQTNTPEAAAALAGSSDSSDADGSDSDDSLIIGSDSDIFIPSPTKKSTQHKQSRLGGSGGLAARPKKKALKADAPRATLVVAPMTLMSQWRDELERSSNGDLSVLMYYGGDRGSVQDELDSGVDVIVTR